ncbi:MAG: FHA domain-containing protein [Planctomycetes bacterium]|nr:FHA domain-containing protein [Planctomycetota bacterium]
MLTLHLTVRDDPRPARTHVVSGPKLLLGRGSQCDLVLDGRELGASAEHARIELLGGTYYVFDQGSTNGTVFNGTRIRAHSSVPISNGDKIYIGRWVVACELVSPRTRRWKQGSVVDPAAHALLQGLEVLAPDAVAPALRARLDAVPPHERGALLAQAESASPQGPLRAAVTAEIERRDEVRDACVQAMASLSLHHTANDAPFERGDDVRRFFRLADQALELMLEWVTGCIQARRAFEEKFSAKVTRFFGLESNPLKHALTATQAGRYLLDWSEPRDAERIKTSLEATLRDLTSHQLGVLAGAQHVARAILARLDPAGLEKESGGAWLAMSAKARAWDHYVATFKDLSENEAKLFNDVVYPALRQGYLETHEAALESATPPAAEGDEAGDQTTLRVEPPAPPA